VRVPELIYIEIETIVKELLIHYHLSRPKSLLYRILFNQRKQQLVHYYFNNIAGAFSSQQKWGTYLFWALDNKMHRVRLSLKENILISEDNKISIPFTPEAVARALQDKAIFPSMAMCYVTVALYYGMKCLGGFCQVHDLTMLKEAWMKILFEADEREEALAVEPVQTKELGGDGMVLAYLNTRKGELVPATGIDLALNKQDTSFEKFVAISRRVTLSDMMNSMLPEMYTVLYPSFQRDGRLASLTPEQISKVIGLHGKIDIEE